MVTQTATAPTGTAEQTSKKHVSSLVTKALSSYGKAHSAVQAAGLAIITHASLYGDCTQAAKLARGVPARERNSLIGWFALYSPIGVALDKDASKDRARFIRPDSKNYHNFDLDGAKANNWFDDPAGANPAPKSLNTLLDFYQSLDRILKKAIKDAEAEDRYDPEQREAVKAQAEDMMTFVNKYRAKHLPKVLGENDIEKAQKVAA